MMDTLNGSVIGAAESALSVYRWNSVSPSALSETDEDDGFCRPIKTEERYDLDDDFAYAPVTPESSESVIKEAPGSNSPITTTIPLASCETAAASLSSAFCKRSNAFGKPVRQVKTFTLKEFFF